MLRISDIYGLRAELDSIEGSTGYTVRAFNPSVTFNTKFAEVTTQTGDIVFSLSGTPIPFIDGLITVVGDGIHDLTFPAYDPTPGVINWVNGNGQTFDNRSRNNIFLFFDGNDIEYSIVKAPTPDVTAPFILSAVISNTAKNKVVLQYSELLDTSSVPATGAFSANLGKAVSSVAVSGSQVTVTMSTDYANGDVATISYTPGGNPIRDVAHNNAVALTNYAITNNVNPARQSASITNVNQLLTTSVVPSNLAWGSTSGGDTPISVSFWIKRNNTTSPYLFEILSQTNAGSANQALILSNTGVITWFFVGNGGALVIDVTPTIPSLTWTHVVLTYDGSTTHTSMHVYYNANLQTIAYRAGTYSGMPDFVSDVRLAIFGRALTGDPEPTLNTALTGFYFWNKELSSAEVTELYNAGQLIDPSTVSFASHLKAAYEFNGTSLDSSSSGYNLTSTVAPTYTADTP